MSLIDNSREIEKIKEIADQIHSDNEIKGPAGVTEYISDYHFDTPVELMAKLNSFWDKQGNECMKAFATVVTVAAFKNKDEHENEDNYKEISPFIYEF